MKTVRKLVYRAVIQHVVLVTLAFSACSFSSSPTAHREAETAKAHRG